MDKDQFREALLEVCKNCPKDMWGLQPEQVMAKFYDEVFSPVHERWIRIQRYDKPMGPKELKAKDQNEKLHDTLVEAMFCFREMEMRHLEMKSQLSKLMKNLELNPMAKEIPLSVLIYLDKLWQVVNKPIEDV